MLVPVRFSKSLGFTLSYLINPLQELGYSVYNIHFQCNQFLGIRCIQCFSVCAMRGYDLAQRILDSASS